jgi:hypothetical protein
MTYSSMYYDWLSPGYPNYYYPYYYYYPYPYYYYPYTYSYPYWYPPSYPQHHRHHSWS